MNFYDRRNKIQILQERAHLYNNLQDHLYDTQVPEHEQPKQIYQQLDNYTVSQLQQVEQKRTNPNATLSQSMAKPPVSVLTTSALISLGLDQYGSMTTNTQDFNSTALARHQEYKNQKGLTPGQVEAIRKAREDDVKRQTILFKADHLKDFEDATHQGFKNHQSQYDQEFVISKQTAEFVKSQEKRNNLQKNDLNQFFEVYLKHKSTLRK